MLQSITFYKYYKKSCLACLVIIIMLLASACSYSTGFTILNVLNTQLEVYYESMPHENVRKPMVMGAQEFNNGNFQWRDLPPDKFVIDTQKGVVKAQVQPNEVLLIESGDGEDIRDNPAKHFDIKKLKLSGANGSVTHEGEKLFKQFQREDKTWFGPTGVVYVIYYK